MHCTNITDDGLFRLAACQPNFLTLDDCPGITDASFRMLRRFKQLNFLRIHRMPITDRALDSIVSELDLFALDLSSTLISDRQLNELQRCKNLQLIYLIDCPEITDVGVNELQVALPDARICRTQQDTYNLRR
jgi:hypothetical protein